MRRAALVLAVVLGAALGVFAWRGVTDSRSHSASAPDRRGSTTTTDAAGPKARVTRHPSPPVRLVERPVGALSSAVQDASAATVPGGAFLLGGLTAADVSTDAIVRVRGASAVQVGRLPVAVHDTAAARLGRSVYLFGGGDGVRQLDGIVRISPGRPTTVGSMPAPSSDQSGATIGDTAYIVGGYTGTRWLDTIVAWRPGTTARVVGHLPQALRYAAVGAAAGRLVIAGGSTVDGSASSSVLVFDPATARVTRVGTLPAPTTHAAAAGLNGLVYVIGGRGAVAGTPVARIVAVNPTRRRVQPAGALDAPRSDLAAIASGDHILLMGGRSAAGTTTGLSVLAPAVVKHYAVPKLVSRNDVYAADRPNMLTGTARNAVSRVYVPNSGSNTVDVIDPHTFKVVDSFPVGGLPQHVVPAYDLRTLYVTNDTGNSLTAIDPQTGKAGRTIPVDDPYNMYFAPDGSAAIVVAERNARLDFRDPHSFALLKSIDTPCRGVDHMDFTADGRYALVSCEFSGQLLQVDVQQQRVVKAFATGGGLGMPQDVKLSPDGHVFYVADMVASGVSVVGARSFRVVGFIHTGRGAHGLYPSRDSRFLYVSNRGEGSISVLSFATRKVVHTWRIPGGGSPDMGGVSADGKVLWLSGRYSSVVYALSTKDGRLLARIPVGSGPHGLCVWPQPGRYSLGHTGILR